MNAYANKQNQIDQNIEFTNKMSKPTQTTNVVGQNASRPPLATLTNIFPNETNSQQTKKQPTASNNGPRILPTSNRSITNSEEDLASSVSNLQISRNPNHEVSEPMSIDSNVEETSKEFYTKVWEDIDRDDYDDPQMASELVNDIYKFLREKESGDIIDHSYMNRQQDINERMRAILIDWMVAVHLKFRLLSETLFLAVDVVDRFLSQNVIIRTQLQLVSITAILIAAKYEEIYPPECNDFVYITDHSYTKEQILEMEIVILNALDFNLTVATSLHFLRRFSKAAGSDWKAHNLAKYLIELPLLDLKMLKHMPSMIAASATYLSRRMLNITPYWSGTLEHYSEYKEEDLRECACELNELLNKVQKSSLKTIGKKYGSSKLGEVSKIPMVEM